MSAHDLQNEANNIKEVILDTLYAEEDISEEKYIELKRTLVITVSKISHFGAFWKALKNKWSKEKRNKEESEGWRYVALKACNKNSISGQEILLRLKKEEDDQSH